MIWFYAIGVIFGVLIAVLVLLRVRGEDDPAVAVYLKRALPSFLTVLAIGILLLLVLLWLLDIYEVSPKFWSAPFIILAAVLGLVTYFIAPAIKMHEREALQRQFCILLIVLIIPIILYGALNEGVDPLLIAGVAFFGNIAAFVFLRSYSSKDD